MAQALLDICLDTEDARTLLASSDRSRQTIRDDFGHLRAFVGGLGALLVAGKAVIIADRYVGTDSVLFPEVGYVCLGTGAPSVLLAAFAGKPRKSP